MCVVAISTDNANREPQTPFSEAVGFCTQATQVLLCHWLRRGVSKICARRRNCGCVVCAKLNLPTFLRVNSFLLFFFVNSQFTPFSLKIQSQCPYK